MPVYLHVAKHCGEPLEMESIDVDDELLSKECLPLRTNLKHHKTQTIVSLRILDYVYCIYKVMIILL